MKNNNRKKKILSSFVPLILILSIGTFIGNKILQEKNDNDNYNNEIVNLMQNNSNVIENKIEENIIEQSQNDENNKDKNDISQDLSVTVNNSIKFDNSVAFIGDSRTQGFIMYNGLKDVQDYSYIGLMVDTAITKKIVKTSNGEKITLLQDMANKNIKNVYIMLGINELGWSYPQVFKSKYKELIDEIRKINPNCKIYLQSIIPMTKTKSDTDNIFNNKNVEIFNKLIQEVANEKNVTYLDVKSVLIDDKGYLPEEASTDGIHINKEYCAKWLKYLKNNS